MKFLKKISIKTPVKIIILLVVFFTLAGFAGSRYGNKVCNKIDVKLIGIEDNYFINEEDVVSALSYDGVPLSGNSFENINLKDLEGKIRKQQYIKSAEVFRGLGGNLVVEAELVKPVARLVQNMAADAYLGVDGRIIPISDRYTPRMMIITGDYVKTIITEKVTEQPESPIMNLIELIEKDEFLKAQISQIDIDKQGNVVLYQQVGKQRIELGKPVNLKSKLKKLEIFYSEILPRKGWNYYERVNLAYDDQIICE
ncbi:cell division protein FtsQ/DivIB [Marinigracilibium pacificum]|uniref:Cell division protein FtsQ n=1 Tax=Marinigracilibium pacificum TaxID=2729599 RepID=A0A848J3K3_9BACT|nr:cell division protein FtsQ [Marinigracilibium pacificum]NMM50085.1 cell division protein FtsQ [Marinigracilibium pacificum]